jgi:hypothetical protein
MMETKFKVGDLVTISKDCECVGYQKLKGEPLVVVSVWGGQYRCASETDPLLMLWAYQNELESRKQKEI